MPRSVFTAADIGLNVSTLRGLGLKGLSHLVSEEKGMHRGSDAQPQRRLGVVLGGIREGVVGGQHKGGHGDQHHWPAAHESDWSLKCPLL